MKMRKTLIIAIGLASFATLGIAPLALAEKYDGPKRCQDMAQECTPGPDPKNSHFCSEFQLACINYNIEHGYRDPSGPGPGPDIHRDPADGGIATPKPGGGGSRRIGGTLKTADGRTVIPMITPAPENKVWFWNGKTTTVVLYSRSNSAVYITVMQGDPDVTLTKVVNGRSYNVADPAYAAAVKAEQAKASGSKGGSKAGTKVGYHPPASPVAGAAASSSTNGGAVTNSGKISTNNGAVTNSGGANSGGAVTNGGVILGHRGGAAGGSSLLSGPGMPRLKAH
jgi:hypothetical protein